jgi:hypothetical protein
MQPAQFTQKLGEEAGGNDLLVFFDYKVTFEEAALRVATGIRHALHWRVVLLAGLLGSGGYLADEDRAAVSAAAACCCN